MAKIIKFPEHASGKINEAISKINEGECIEAKKLLVELINAGCSEANGYLAHIYEYGCNDIEQNIDKAIFYYENSLAGYGDLESVLALARINYYHGQEARDIDKAKYYYTLAEEYEDPIAYLNLGRMYEKGEGFKPDLDKARQYYKKAIEHGYVYGYTFLAILEKNHDGWFKSLLYRLKSFLKALPIAIRDPDDVRLKYQ